MLKRHELSVMFEGLPPQESVMAHGVQQHPIILLDGQVIHGWHRYQACLQAGQEPRFDGFDGDVHAAHAWILSQQGA